LATGSDGGLGADDGGLGRVFLNERGWARSGRGQAQGAEASRGRRDGNAGRRDSGKRGNGLGSNDLVQLPVDSAIALAFLGDGRALTISRAHSLTTIPHQTFRAGVTGDARSFANKVLIPGFVVRIDDRRHAGGGPLESFLAQAVVTFANDAVDATVSAGSANRDWLSWDGHRLRFHVFRPIRAFFAVAVFGRKASLLPGLLSAEIEQLSGGTLTNFPGEDAVAKLADKILCRIVRTASFALPNLASGKPRKIHSSIFEICGADFIRYAAGLAPMGDDRHQKNNRAKSHRAVTREPKN